MANLDGTEKIIHTPYDAHEQIVRKPHTHDLEHGYQPKVEEEAREEAPAIKRQSRKKEE